MTLREGSSPGVVAGIDAAIVAAHHVAIRDGDRLVQFKVQPTLAGMAGSDSVGEGWTSGPSMLTSVPFAGLDINKQGAGRILSGEHSQSSGSSVRSDERWKSTT